jgi:N4-gp56 family major capsid protein
MAIQNFNTQAARVNKLKGEILAKAMAVEVLGITGMQKQHPKNVGDNVTFRRWLPYGGVDNRWITGTNVNSYANNHITTEGVTPSADTLSAVDITATLQQYSCLYGYTAKTAWAYEDAIPPEMEKMVGERIGRVNELVNYGAMKSTTNQWFGGTGTSIATVDGGMTLGVLQNVVRGIMAQHGEMCTTVLKPGEAFDTTAVEGGYVALISTDL